MPLTLLLVALLSASPRVQDPPTPAEFDTLAGRAAAARQGDRLDEAMDLYAQALELRPEWDEGWWYLGTLRYDARRFPAAVEAFQRFTELKPEISAGWVLLGINERQVPDYAAAIEHIQKGLDLGIGGPLKQEAWYQISLALIKTEQFERAVEPLTLLARTAPESRPGLARHHRAADTAQAASALGGPRGAAGARGRRGSGGVPGPRPARRGGRPGLRGPGRDLAGGALGPLRPGGLPAAAAGTPAASPLSAGSSR